jgi:hypothetical protein
LDRKGEPDEEDRDRVLRLNWDRNQGGGTLKPKYEAKLTWKKDFKGCGAAWCVTLEIGTGKRTPLSVMPTDI